MCAARGRRQSSTPDRTEICIRFSGYGNATASLTASPLSPAAAFPHALDHPRQPLGRIPPVAPYRHLSTRGVPGIDRVDDHLVLRHAGADLLRQHADVEAHIALRLWLDRVVQHQEARSCASLDTGVMEARIQLEERVGIGSLETGLAPELLVGLLKGARDAGAHGPVQLCSPARSETLQLTDDPEELAGVRLGERRHGGSALAAIRSHDVALLLQPLERFACGRPAHPKSLCDFGLDDASAGRELTQDNDLAQPVIGRVSGAIDAGSEGSCGHGDKRWGFRHTASKTYLYSLPYAIGVVKLDPGPLAWPVGHPSPVCTMDSRFTSTEQTGTEPDLVIRPLVSPADFAACVQLQRTTWGEEFREVVGATLLKIAQRVGGVAAGAFEPDGEMCGFVFGMTGVENGRPVHWSHMLAVRPDARDRGIGRRLKEFQSAWLRERNVDRVLWTFDPLVARNAHLNLNRLGVLVTEYIADMYGPDTGSPLHSGLGTDRLLVVWRLNGEPARAAPDSAPEIRIEIPADIQALKEADPFEAYNWRDTVRRAFATYLSRGWQVSGFTRDTATGRCAYVLRQPAHAEREADR